jgi:hypothetical protein
MWKQDQVWGLLKLATCYNGLGRVVEAGREVIKCVEMAQTMGTTDCLDGNMEGCRRHIYSEIAKFDQLLDFLDPMVIFSREPRISDLSLKERLQLHQIVKPADETRKEDEELDKQRAKLVQSMKDIKKMMEESPIKLGAETVRRMDETIAAWDREQERNAVDYLPFF